MFSLLIKQAKVVDGTGQKPQILDVAVENDRIVAINPEINSSAHTVVDGTGMVLAPGFIDTQNHSDSYWQLFNNPTLESLVTQGYTTAVVGNSGTSLAPLVSNESILSIQKYQSTTGLNVNWRSFAEYKATLRGFHFGANITSLIGYSTVRRGLLGDRVEPPSEEELETLLATLDISLKEGAAGISVGLQYSHELNVTATELVSLAELCVKHNKLLSVSLRSESENISDSVREIAALAEQTGVKLKISHLKIRYKENWPEINNVLEELESVWHRGANIHFDTYPYTYAWQPLYTYLPKWALEGGRTHLLNRLKDPDQRKKIITELINHPAEVKDFIVASASHQLRVNGKTISQIASDMQTTPEEAVLNIVEHGGSNTLIFDNCVSEEVVTDLVNHPLGFIATNGGGFKVEHEEKLIHPRCFGAAPKFLRETIDSKTISLEEAIRKLTSGPADKVNLMDRGRIAVDAKADLVLFDPEKIDSQASYKNPYRYSQGIKSVWVNGVQVSTNGHPTGSVPGVFLD